jgi:type III restriction enzyme
VARLPAKTHSRARVAGSRQHHSGKIGFQHYRAKPEFSALYPFSAAEAHGGYFSQDKQGHFKDSTEKGSQDDNDTYALIMRDKERLLDPIEPLRFIFSHSALREGWDNPNVFQICTLAETSSEIKKRQEIGRGLRLAVNDKGERIFDRNLNRLTIVANESYEEFAKALQTEMEEQGITFKKEMVLHRCCPH